MCNDTNEVFAVLLCCNHDCVLCRVLHTCIQLEFRPPNADKLFASLTTAITSIFGRLDLLERRYLRLADLFAIICQVRKYATRRDDVMRPSSGLVISVGFFPKILSEYAQMPSLEEFCSFCGFEDVLQGCSSVTQEMQSRAYDPLDIENAAFDRDYLEYSVNISDLKNSLQVKYCDASQKSRTLMT